MLYCRGFGPLVLSTGGSATGVSSALAAGLFGGVFLVIRAMGVNLRHGTGKRKGKKRQRG